MVFKSENDFLAWLMFTLKRHNIINKENGDGLHRATQTVKSQGEEYIGEFSVFLDLYHAGLFSNI